jgi:hypothetical protein
MKKIAVIISNEIEFREFMRLVSLNDKGKFQRVSNIVHTKGVEFSEHITLGNTNMIPGYDEILNEVKSRMR